MTSSTGPHVHHTQPGDAGQGGENDQVDDSDDALRIQAGGTEPYGKLAGLTDLRSHLVSQVAISVYAVITLLGVTAAASLKKYATTEGELLAILIGASAAVSVAHVWASIMAHRLVHHSFPDKVELRREAQIVGTFFAVTGLTFAVVFVSALLGFSFDDAILWAEIALVAALFILGTAGALWARAGWLRALGWGMIDASIGVVIVVIKLIVG